MMRGWDYLNNFVALLFMGSALSAFGEPLADEEVRQKLNFADTFISSSAASKRIAGSDRADAKSKYQAAQERLRQAKDAFAAGKLDEAGTASTEAMSLMSQAAQLVPSESVQQMARNRNERLLSSLETLAASYQAAAGEPGAHDASGLDSTAIHKMTDESRALAASGKFDDANRILAAAIDRVSDALNTLHGSTTISYEMKFSSPAEEYAYELKRYISLEDALPLAIEQMQPPQEKIDEAQEYINKAKERRRQAEAEVQQEKYEAALEQIKDGSLQMETALNVLGVTY
jgi:hypothetical protein